MQSFSLLRWTGRIGRVVFVTGAVMGSGVASATAAELVVLCTQALRTSVLDLAPRFEQATGHKLVVTIAPTGQLLQRVRQGEQADVLIASASGLQGGLSGNSFEGVLDKLGIKEAVKAKAKLGSPAAGFVVRGEADIAVQQIPELIAVQGAELVGPLPPELDQVTPFSAAALARARQPDVAQAWLKFLTGSEAAAVIKSKGLTPVS